MRNRQQADGLASTTLAHLAEISGLELAFTGEPLERKTAWVYFYTSKAHLETGDVSHALAGNGPIVVPRAYVDVWFAWTGSSIEDQVE